MLDIQQIALYAGAFMTIIAFVMYFIQPIMKNFTKITENLTKMSHSLDLLNRDLEASKNDRREIHGKINKMDERLDTHQVTLAEHREQLRTLFKERK